MMTLIEQSSLVQDSDPVLEECPVFMSSTLTPNLYLLNLPSKHSSHILSSEGIKGDVLDVKARFKPKCGLFELSLPLDAKHPVLLHMTESNESDYINSITQKIIGTNVPCTGATYAMARMTSVGLCLTPATGVIDMYVDQSHLDEADRQAHLRQKQATDSKEEFDFDDNESNASDRLPVRQIAVQVRKRETEEQVNARLTSYAYLKKVQEDEPWKDLNKIYSEHSAQSKYLLDEQQEQELNREELIKTKSQFVEGEFDESIAKDYLLRLTGQSNK